MILQNIRLHPFAGLSDLALDFEPGLNVLVGPNEAGKSTIFTGLKRALFTPVRLHKRDYQAYIEPLLPIGGGDTITVTLGLTTLGKSYTLQRTWGGTKAESLTLPNGTQVTDAENIISHLEALLPAKEGTFNSVLMTYQSGLSKTLDDLEQEPDSIQTLGSILRRTVYETDGVQVDVFRDEIAKRYKNYFERWDRENKRPEDETREFSRNVGQILRAYYDLEHAKKALGDAQSYEKQIDIFNQKIAGLDDEIEDKNKYVIKNQSIVESLQQRQLLESQMESTLGRIERYGEDNSAWPLSESKVSEIQAQLPSLKEKEEALKDEREKSKIVAQNQGKHKRVQELQKLKLEYEKVIEDTTRIQEVTQGNIDEIKQLENDIRLIRSELSSGAFHFKVKAHKDLSLLVTSGLEESKIEEISANASFESNAEGFINLKHSDWEIEVQLKEQDLEDKRLKLLELEEQQREKLKYFGVDSIEEVVHLNTVYEDASSKIAYAKRRFEDALGEDDLDGLLAELGETIDSEEVRTEVLIVEELSEIQRQIENLTTSLSTHQEKLNSLIERYNDKRTLLLSLAKETQNQDDIQKKIDDLVPIPEGVDDIEDFIKSFENTKTELEEKKEERNALLLDRKDFEKTEPDFSAEELKLRYEEADTFFERELQTGESIGQIYDLTSQLADEMDTQTYQGLEDSLSHYVSVITDNRYSQVDMNQSMPQGFIRNDGEVLPYNLLSAGTRDVLALSLRLSMAQYFLQEAEGVLVLDDPFVDLDPERQEMGAKVIQEFASDKQVLLFTCHPSHADILGGNRIDLARPVSL